MFNDRFRISLVVVLAGNSDFAFDLVSYGRRLVGSIRENSTSIKCGII